MGFFEGMEIRSYLQPIFSFKTQDLVGFEALCRGFKSDKLIYPGELFTLANSLNKLGELEEICRYSAIDYYKRLRQEDKILFINFDMSAIKDKNSLEEFIFNLKGVNFNYVCIELIESKVDFRFLMYAVSLFKYYGFLIALDDFGTGHSNYNRLSFIKPDILKLDMGLIRDIHLSLERQYIVKSLVYLMHNLGGLVLAEGIEQEEELFVCMDNGVDMFQGFLLSKPQCYKSIDLHALSNSFTTYISKYENYRLTNIEKYVHQISTFKHIVENIAKSLTVENFKHYVDIYDFIRAIYLLDWEGNMIYDTVFKRNHVKPLFKPAKKGDNLSFKDYFIHIRYYGKDLYVSDPYISQADGKQCITISYKTSGDDPFILCVDFTL